MPYRYLLILLILLQGLVSCADTIESVTHVNIAEDAVLLLTLPKQKKQLKQYIQMTYQDKSHELILLTEFDHNYIAMVGMTPGGIPLFDIHFSGKQALQVNNYFTVESLQAKYILADLQLVYWPVNRLQQQLSEAVTIKILADGSREISAENQQIINIKQQNDKIIFYHLQRDYYFTVTNIE